MASGVLNINKPAGLTSFQVVHRIKRALKARRVGHAGTLDPLATGVLPILLESATRLSDYAHELDKTYRARFHFGFRSATDDAEGELEAVADPGRLDREAVAAALESFRGRILQRPPAYSAVKVDGERSYRLARRGQAPELEPREVFVRRITLVDFEPGPAAVAEVEVVCGSGTYLRALARDTGELVGVGGYLGSLVRTAYGPLRVEDALGEEALDSGDQLEAHLLPANILLEGMEVVRLTPEQEAQVRQGRAVRVFPEPGKGELQAVNERQQLVAIGRREPLRRWFVPEKVFNP